MPLRPPIDWVDRRNACSDNGGPLREQVLPAPRDCGRIVASHAGHLMLAVAMVCVPALAEDSAHADIATTLPALIEDSSRDAIGSGPLYETCAKDPKKAADILVRYIRDERPNVRSTVIALLGRYDLDGSLEHIIDAIPSRHDLAVRAVTRVRWTPDTDHLRTRARKYISEWMREVDSPFCASALGIIGTTEDLALLREMLNRALSGKVQMFDSQLRMQERWEQDRVGLSPLEGVALEFRQAMARLGDSEQLEFFRRRLLSSDLERARDALKRAKYIHATALADAVASWLADPTGVESVDYHPYTATDTLAALTLMELFPDEARNIKRGELLPYWRSWAAGRGWQTSRPDRPTLPEATGSVPPEHVNEAPLSTPSNSEQTPAGDFRSPADHPPVATRSSENRGPSSGASRPPSREMSWIITCCVIAGAIAALMFVARRWTRE